MSAHFYVYFFGEIDGKYIKNGITKLDTLRTRLHRVQRELHGQYDLLAAVPGTRSEETKIQKFFAAYRAKEFPFKDDTFDAVPELVEYVNWLRQQWFTTLDLDDLLDDVVVDFDQWRPEPERRAAPPIDDPGKLVQTNRAFTGPLAATAWDWMAAPEEVGEDFYTPVEIVEAAADAMGGLDLDPASHYRANRKLMIPTIYTRGRDAFENPWFGRVWLNPPHGEYGRWFDRIIESVDAGDLEQLCMIAPAWAFITNRAREIMRSYVRATVLLTPTPKFWGDEDGGTGSNHPHLIVYVGDRVDEFLDAFEPFGIPVEIRKKEAVVL